jgi:hypothetical protein
MNERYRDLISIKMLHLRSALMKFEEAMIPNFKPVKKEEHWEINHSIFNK